MFYTIFDVRTQKLRFGTFEWFKLINVYVLNI